MTRHGPNLWMPVGRPEYLRQCCLMSLRRLGVETIDLFQLHRIDAAYPLEDQVGGMLCVHRSGLQLGGVNWRPGR